MSSSNNNVPRVQTAVRIRVPFINEDVFLNVAPELNVLTMGSTVVSHSADYLFGCGYPQEMVFETSAKPLLDKFIRAEEDVSIIAFGPQSSGKTFTLFGHGIQVTESAMFYGIFPRLATYIFSQYDPCMFTGDDALVVIEVAFFEIEKTQVRNLLNNAFVSRYCQAQITAGKFEQFLDQLDYEVCHSARHMMQCMNTAMQNKQSYGTHVFAVVAIDQPSLKGAHYTRIRTSALFGELGDTVFEQQFMTNNYNPNIRNFMLIPEDRVLLNVLSGSHGGKLSSNLYVPPDNLLHNVLKTSFNDSRATLLLCCISPGFHQMTISSDYLATLTNVHNMRSSYYLDSFDVPRNNDLQNKANSLISEAESLFSRLSVSQSISEEDQEKLKNWLHLKKECEDDSVNAQSHGQLECIEEVTESEEEIASSDEKMSESPVSLDNSLSESDQEEGHSKVCQLSDNNFFSSLDNMCFQFNAFVDNFVNSFKAKTSLYPAKERERDYSANRRGGMTELPKVNELRSSNCILDSIDLVQTTNQSFQKDNLSSGCLKKTTSDREMRTSQCSHERKSDTSHEKARMVKAGENDNCFILSSSQQEKRAAVVGLEEENIEKKELNENDPDHGKYITWSMVDPTMLQDYDIYNWLKRQEEELKMIRAAWFNCMKQMSTADVKGRPGEAKALEVKRNKQMFYGVAGIDPFIDMMKDNLRLDYFDVDDASYGFNHNIRLHRFGRQDFTRHKKRLDTNIKNRTATEEEMRDYLMADEMMETLDSCIELLNFMVINNKPVTQKLPNTAVGKDVRDKLKSLSSLEMRHLMFKYFIKVVDLRENSKLMENVIADYEQKLELAQLKILTLSRALQEMRSQQSQVQAMAKYSRHGHDAEGAYNGHAPTSPLALPEGSKSRKEPRIPQQNLSKLQVTKAPPPPKVTFKNNKLIIEKPNNEK